MITSPDNPRIKDVLRLRKSRERRRAGLFIAEGQREVERARAAGLRIQATYFAPELLAWDEGEEVSARVLAKMAYRAEPEGVLALVEIPRRTLPAAASLILVAVGIEKPGNLGAMARTADAAGADALLVADANVDPWNPNAIRASTGAVFTLPILEVRRDEVAALPQTRIATVVDSSRSHSDTDLTRPVALLVGSEDAGLDAAWLELADETVSIPMRGTTTDSLNASTAAAIVLFEALRQRTIPR
ncbi:MAG: methyltransferase, TrmH family [Gaiellaceae bacterium]|nr:methyltransferase, TrmH family [Gaiellaceae bacterium]